VCVHAYVYNKKKRKKNDGRPRTALHNLSYIVKVSYFRVSLSSLALIPYSQRHHHCCRGGSHTHTHTRTRVYIIYNTHTSTIYVYRYTEIVSLSVFVCIYLNVISAVLNMRLYRAASSFAQHARARERPRRTPSARPRRRFSSLTPYCTPPYT